MASRYRFHTRLSTRQRTSLRLRYLGGTALLASAIGLQVLLLGNLGDGEPALAQADTHQGVGFRADLSLGPEGVFVSPPTVRNGSGCKAGPTDRCMTFTVLLHPDAEGLVFEQIAGDKPTGNTLYYVDCDKAARVGSSICIPSHNGKVTISYCAPGTQTGVYRVTSIGKIRLQADSTATIGNPLEFRIAGLQPSTVKWTSIYPGKAGAFDEYLTEGRSEGSVIMTPDEKLPGQMRFVVTGRHRSACGDVDTYTDTVSLTIYSQLMAAATPDNAVCAEGGTVTLNARAFGGKAPYTFSWKDEQGRVIANTSECAVSGSGRFTLLVTDARNKTAEHMVNVWPAKVTLPLNVRVEDAKQENAVVAWQPLPQATRFAVRTRAQGTSVWLYKRCDGSATNVKLKDLQPGQAYELQLMAYGAGSDSSGWSSTQTFSTEGPCQNANNLRYKIRNGDAWFYWTLNPYSTRQELVMKRKGAPDWERRYKLGKNVNSVVVDNLKGGVEYEWAIKSYCPDGNYNGAKEFTVSPSEIVSLTSTAAGNTVAVNVQP